MPIKVTCQCGKSFSAKDELAGKAVKCPNCQKPLRIPAANQPAAPAAAPKKQAPKAAAPKPVAAPKPTSDTDDAYDDLGLAPQEAGSRPCPGCGSALPENAVLCIRCGYNIKLGRRMETVKIGGDAGEGGHGAVSADLLNRAAQVIDEDKQEDIKKTKQGLPWWVWLVILIILGGFLSYMIIRANREEAKPKEPTATRSISEGLPTLTRRASEGIRLTSPENVA
jgi:hypothetical protein